MNDFIKQIRYIRVRKKKLTLSSLIKMADYFKNLKKKKKIVYLKRNKMKIK